MSDYKDPKRQTDALELVGGNPWHLTHADTCAIQRDTDEPCSCGLAELRDAYDREHL